MLKKSNRVKSFTLIELLVVIAIISILVALIAPAIKGAKDQAKTVGCMNNLHQIGIAFELYGQDKHTYPSFFPVMISAARFGSFSFELSLYLGKPNCSKTAGRNSRSPIFQCPASIAKGTNVLCTYSENISFGVTKSGKTLRPFPLTIRPSEIVALMDGNQIFESICDGDSYYTITVPDGGYILDPSTADQPFDDVGDNQDLPPGTLGAIIRFRHQNNTIANALFVDGHVKSLKANEVLVRNFCVDE